MSAAPKPKTLLIVTTGDCSDYDGFTALPIYKAAAKSYCHQNPGAFAVVHFIINYPAFLGESAFLAKPNNEDYKSWYNYVMKIDDNGRKFKRHDTNGYTYSAKEYYTARSPGIFEQYSNAFGIPPIDDQVFPKNLNTDDTFSKQAFYWMTFVTIVLAWTIWGNNDDKSVRLEFSIGGINTFNGFAIDTYKNELQVYFDTVQSNFTTLGDFIKTTPINGLNLSNDALKIYNNKEEFKIYFDMNGSMAWLNESTKKINNLLENIEGAYIMGGILPPNDKQTSKDKITKMTVIPNLQFQFMVKPQFSTFNQIYAPLGTHNFLKQIPTEKIFVISNNLCNDIVNFDLDDEDKSDRPTFTNFLKDDLKLNKSSIDAYKLFLKVPGAKPIIFDLLSAVIMAHNIVKSDERIVFTPGYIAYDAYTEQGDAATGQMSFFISDKGNAPTTFNGIKTQRSPSHKPFGLDSTYPTVMNNVKYVGISGENNKAKRETFKTIISDIYSAVKKGGRIAKTHFTRSSERVSISGRNMLVYYGSRNAKYVKSKGAYVSLAKYTKLLVNNKNKK